MFKSNNPFYQFIIFGIIGGVGLFVNLGLYSLFVLTFLQGREMVANVLAVCLTISFNWVGNKVLAFKNSDKKAHVEALQFFISSAIALPLNMICLYISRDIMGYKDLLSGNISLIVATGIGMIVKFLLYKFWVFKPSKNKN